MHGLAHSTTFNQILAIDLGKFNSVVCLYDAQTAEHRFVALANTPQAIHDLLVEQAGSDPSSTLVVFETCDCSGWVYDIATALGFAVAVANPSHEAWRWKRVKRKTDRDDAIKLAQMAAMRQLPTVYMPSPDQRQKRRLVHHRRVLVQRQTEIKNFIRSIFSQQGIALPQGNKCWTAAGIAQVAEQSKTLSECEVNELWRGRLHVELQLLETIHQQILILDRRLDGLGRADEKIQRLQTVPGVGPRLAEAVVVHLDDPHRFANARQVSSYAGLVPKQIESGTMKRVGKITRRGPSLLRGMLVEVAWMVYRHNAWARAFVNKVSRGMKQRKKIAIVALARKLLVILWAMLRDGTSWRDPDQKDGRHTAGGEGCSPPEDTGPKTAVSSCVGVIG
ncbi:MAG TPA: IS110 family transposase [Tepidisphaeraceae bacterium]|nr:IS110 family transposase [Tepidisphaeraceae bacterium]